jgi:TonB family protein
MMTRIQSPKAAAAKVLPGLLAAGALLVAFACEQRTSVSSSPVGILSENQTTASISANGENVTEEEQASLPGLFVVAKADPNDDRNNAEANEKIQIQAQSSPNIETETTVVFHGDTAIITGTPENIRKLENMFSSNLSVKSQRSSGSTAMLRVTNKVSSVNIAQAQEPPADEQVFFIVEEMPEFPGGESALRNFIAQTIKYPVAAQELGIQGRVYVTFIVSKSGKVADAKIARGVDPVLDQEALRVVNALPLWKPGIQRGKPVNVSYTVPINFSLQ